ncbi:MAG TPA: PIN domain-containing protein [Thermodesulfobacteriota bacterium]|nr:PIN domain-containing protein [Thermodesulfobacteriota bacterium]
MKLDNLKAGLEVFIDANIFIYHFTGVSEECSRFLSRCEQEELKGVSSANVILEVLHRLMMVEAVNKNLVRPPNIVKKLKRSSKKVTALKDYFANIQNIIEMGIEIKSFSLETILKSQRIREKFGFLVNDSLIVASMEEDGIYDLATNDEEFTKIRGINVYRPTDVML